MAKFKTCNKCFVEKSVDDFHKDASRHMGVANRCRPCVSAHLKDYYAKNRDAVKAKVKSRTEAMDQLILSRYQSEYSKLNRDQKNENNRRYQKRYPERNREKSMQRYADKNKRTPVWVDKSEVAKVYELAQFITEESGQMYHVDHVIPLKGSAVSGLHVHTNMQVIPADMNLRKSNSFCAGGVV